MTAVLTVKPNLFISGGASCTVLAMTPLTTRVPPVARRSAATAMTSASAPPLPPTKIRSGAGSRSSASGARPGTGTILNVRNLTMFFLSVGMIDEVVAELTAGGYPADTPVAVVEKVSWPDERQLRGTLATIARQVKEAAITRTAIIAVGRVLADSPPPALSRLYDSAFTHGYRQGTVSE